MQQRLPAGFNLDWEYWLDGMYHILLSTTSIKLFSQYAVSTGRSATEQLLLDNQCFISCQWDIKPGCFKDLPSLVISVL